MPLFLWSVMMQDGAGTAHCIAEFPAESKRQAERRAHARYGEHVWVQASASRAADGGRTERLLERFQQKDRRWLKHRFKDDEDWEDS